MVERCHRADPIELHAAIQKILRDIIADHGSVIFNGDGYSDEWHREAADRGLPNLPSTADALPVLSDDEVVSLFEDVCRSLEHAGIEVPCRHAAASAALLSLLACGTALGGRTERFGLYVRLPEHVENVTEPRGMFSGNAYIERWSIRDADARSISSS